MQRKILPDEQERHIMLEVYHSGEPLNSNEALRHVSMRFLHQPLHEEFASSLTLESPIVVHDEFTCRQRSPHSSRTAATCPLCRCKTAG
ncbi:Ankyrin-3 [Fusarium oxysporum f. sp. albedinis]|nr:Ankyrin-3 [Fusarium oxysporum f. sp. albedinis]